MRARLLAAGAAIGVALAPAAGARDHDEPGRLSYELYCASCHGPEGGGGATSLRPHENAPPLSGLGEKYGLPLPHERLAKFVQLDTRPGGGHICGDRLLETIPGLRARGLLERVIVAEALGYLDRLQQPPEE
jgi:hypothetical protein